MSLTVLITSADGAVYRCGADEPDAAWVPVGITWSSQIPGGWKEARFDLLRRIDEDIPLRLFDEVEILDEHGATMYEGRIMQLPRQHGDDVLLGVVCMGWASHLLDDPSFREIYIDRDLSRWGDPTLAHRIEFVGLGFQNDWQISVEGNSIVHSTGEINQPGTTRKQAESWYHGQGIDIGILYYQHSSDGLNSADTNWVTLARLVNGDTLASGGDEGTDHNGADASDFLVATGAGRKFAQLTTYYDASYTAGPPPGGWNAYWSNLAVYGNHGIPGAPGSGDPPGLYIDLMLANALSRAAPKLNWTIGTGGLSTTSVDVSIQRPPVAVPQAAYLDPGTVENVVLDLNKYVLWDWVVYEKKTFFYRPTDPNGLTWEARLDQGVHLSLEGDDAEHVYNGAIVRFSWPDGTKRVAGPPGSGFDVESAQLVDTDPENTVSQHGYPRKWIELDVSFPLYPDDLAVTIGAAYLAQASIPSRSGDIELTGDVEHPTQGMRPAREIKAGEYIRLSDHPADVPRRIISVRHSDWDQKTTVTVGNTLDTVAAILEQLGVITNVRLGS